MITYGLTAAARLVGWTYSPLLALLHIFWICILIQVLTNLEFNSDSTRVSNELGAGHPDRAKHAMGVTLKLSLVLGLCFVLALVFGHDIWIQMFSSSTTIREEFATITPLLAISILLDAIQGVLSGLISSFSFNMCCVCKLDLQLKILNGKIVFDNAGVARGCGWQHLAASINLATFYLIGLPISCLLGFKTNLQFKVKYLLRRLVMFVQMTRRIIILTVRSIKKDFENCYIFIRNYVLEWCGIIGGLWINKWALPVHFI